MLTNSYKELKAEFELKSASTKYQTKDQHSNTFLTGMCGIWRATLDVYSLLSESNERGVVG